MSVNFSNLWNHTNSSHVSGSGSTDQVTANAEAARNGNAKVPPGDLRDMVAGQTFSGEIVDIKGKDVQIMLDNHTFLQARLESELKLALGQSLIFEVKSNVGGTLALTPLFANLSLDPNIDKALSMANLPLNDQTRAMVAAMMEEGMPIHKNALQEMYRQVNAFSQSNVESLVEMVKLKLAVTPENLEQFTNYKNYEHQLTGGIAEVLKEVPDAVLELLKSGNAKSAAELFDRLVSLFTKGEALGGEGTGGPSNLMQSPGKQQGITGLPQQEAALTQDNLPGIDRNSTEGKIIISAPGMEQSLDRTGNTSGNMPDSMLEAAKEDGEALHTMSQKNVLSDSVSASLSGQDKTGQLLSLLEQSGVPKEQLQELKEGKLSIPNLLQAAAEAFVKNGAFRPAVFEQLFSSGAFRSLLKHQGEKHLLLNPEQVGGDKKVEEYYQRLNEFTNKLLQAAETAQRDGQPLMKSASNLQNNLNFMNQLNQSFTYLQLPLKMNQKNTNGELYVFTNKKNLAKKDGNISAFLHLDMSSIGTVDIYVAMQKEKLSTKFYLEREELIDFMEANMHLLNERLEAKGYSIQSQVLKKEEDVNVVDEILKQGNSVPLMSKYSFDVRA